MPEKQDRIGAEDLRKDWERRGRPRTAFGLLFEIAEKSKTDPDWAEKNNGLIRKVFSAPEVQEFFNAVTDTIASPGRQAFMAEFAARQLMLSNTLAVSRLLEPQGAARKGLEASLPGMQFRRLVEQGMRRVASELEKVTSAALQKQIDLLRPVAEGAAAIETLARQPLMVSNPGEWARLKKLASEKRRAEVKKILTNRAKDVERYWLACLGLTPGRPGRHRVPIDKTQPYKCALLVKSCLPRLKQVYEEKRRIKRGSAKAIKRNPLILRRKLTEAGCIQEEVDLAVKYNTPLRAARELVAKNLHLSEDTVARYYRVHRKNLGPSVAGADVLEPEGGR